MVAERDAVLALDKVATHLKYFSAKQDVVLIKNLTAAAQQRWERVGMRVAERSRQLDQGHREGKMFRDSWQVCLSDWLSLAVYLSICVLVCVCTCLFVYLSVCVLVCFWQDVP